MSKLTKEIIEAAIEGFERQKQRIDTEIAELRSMLDPAPKTPTPTSSTERKKRGVSAKGRKAIAEGQRRRWAAVREESVPPKATNKPKRKLSAAGKAAIVAALKRRWAAKKAARA